MNLQALFDAVLALVALWVAMRPARHWPALRLACLLLAAAAVLGALRFSGLLPLPALHQFASLLGAGVALPLLAISLAQPASAVARQRRYAWIFAVVAAVLCILLAMLAQIKLWPSACALLAALALLVAAIRRRDGLAAAAGGFVMLALLAFAGKLQAAGFLPGDFLHIGLAVGLAIVGRWALVSESAGMDGSSAQAVPAKLERDRTALFAIGNRPGADQPPGFTNRPEEE